MPRLLRPLLLALSLVAPAALAETLYRIELIVFRQAQPVEASQPAPEDWAGDLPVLSAAAQRSPALGDTARQLEEQLGYPVLLHLSWQQDADDAAGGVRFATGPAQDGHHPLEGLLRLQGGRYLQLELQAWTNRFDADGFLAASEHLQHRRRLVPGQLTYLDHPSLGALIRVHAP